MNLLNRKQNDALTAYLGSLCFFLSAIEYLIPKPLPFLRLGIANLPIMLAIDLLSFRSFLTLMLIKIIGQGLIGGTLFSYIILFSAAGTAASALLMYGARKALSGKISFIGLSVLGAFSSNAAQLILARWYIFGEGAWYIAPPFLVIGAVTGTALGFFANSFTDKSRWLASIRSENHDFSLPADEAISSSRQSSRRAVFLRLLAGSTMLLLLLFATDIRLQAILTILALVLASVSGQKIRLIPILAISAGIIAFNLAIPFGKVLLTIGPFPITEGALLSGIKKALTIEGMIFISRWMLQYGLRIPGRFGKMVSQALSSLTLLSQKASIVTPKSLIASIDQLLFSCAPWKGLR